MSNESNKKKKISLGGHIKNIALYLLILAVLAWLALCGFFTTEDNKIKDSFYQEPSSINPFVYVIGIDEKTLSAYGNKIDNWGRGKLAEMIDLLNRDPATAPAVIGIDMCIFGDLETDATGNTPKLVEAMKRAGNVILVEQAITGIAVEESDGSFTVGREIRYFDRPCDELCDAALDIGHCNMFLDEDSVARHGLSSLVKDGEIHSSLAYEVFSHFTGTDDERFNRPGTRFLIDYSGIPGDYFGSSFAGSSFMDVLDGTYPKEVFAGSAVLIGAFAMGMTDNYQASVGGQMQGVEIHANMVAQMIDGRYKTELPEWMTAVVLVLLGLVILAIMSNMNEKYGFIVALVFVVLYVFSARALYKTAGVVLPLFGPVLSSLIIILVYILARFAASLIEKRLVLDRFSRYLAPAVAERISDTTIAEAWPAREADIAVMYVDVHSFTAISEIIGQDVVGMLKGFFDVVLESAFRYEGTCDKMIGDCAMFLFGAPLDVKDYEYKAVLAALDMKKKLEEGAVKVDLGNGPVPITVGIGIACGPVVCGEMGSSKYRVEYTAIGDTVNTASRVQSMAGVNEILITEEMYRRLKARIDCSEKGMFALKGKTKETRIYSVNGIL